MRLRYKIGAVILCLSGLFGFIKMRGCDKKIDAGNSSTVLLPGEEEKVIVDPTRHRITLVTPTRLKVVNLPDRPSSIVLFKGDGLKIYAPQYGTEIRPFLVGAFDLNGGKLGVGTDLFYYKKIDIGAGILTNPSRLQDTTAFVGISYFLYSNTSLMLGINNQIRPTIGIKVRL